MAGSRSESKDNFLQKLGARITDPQFADFTIVNCGQEYKVHKLVLSLHSNYFDRLFKSRFIEASENRIVLEEDPKLAVKYMIDYFYKFDYKVNFDDVPLHDDLVRASLDASYRSDMMGRIAVDDASQPPEAALNSHLEAHAFVYTLADKYDIPNLKVLAKEKFREEAFYSTRSDDVLYLFLKLVPFVYEHTAPGELGLRPCIVDAWCAKAEYINGVLGDQNLRDLIERVPDLGADLFIGRVDGHPPPSKKKDRRGGRRGDPTLNQLQGGPMHSRGYVCP